MKVLQVEEKRNQLVQSVIERLQPQCPVEYASTFTLAMDAVRLQRLEAAQEAAVVDAQRKAHEETLFTLQLKKSSRRSSKSARASSRVRGFQGWVVRTWGQRYDPDPGQLS